MQTPLSIILITLLTTNATYSEHNTSEWEHSVNVSKLSEAIRYSDAYVVRDLLNNTIKDDSSLSRALDRSQDTLTELKKIIAQREQNLLMLSQDKNALINCQCHSIHQKKLWQDCNDFVGQIDHISRSFPELLHEHLISIARTEIVRRANETYESHKQDTILAPLSKKTRHSSTEIYSRNFEGKEPATIYEQYQIAEEIEKEVKQAYNDSFTRKLL